MGQNQFSLRAIFAITAIVAILSLMGANRRAIARWIDSFDPEWWYMPQGIIAGAVVGSAIGSKWNARVPGGCIGAVTGAMIGAIAMPAVQ